MTIAWVNTSPNYLKRKKTSICPPCICDSCVYMNELSIFEFGILTKKDYIDPKGRISVCWLPPIKYCPECGIKVEK